MNEPMSEMGSYCTLVQDQVLCFDLLKPAEYELIKSKMLVVNYKVGESLCKQGSFASHIIILRQGLVKLYMENGNESLVIQILPPNNIIGLSSCFAGSSVFYYSAQAYMDSTAQLIDMGVFMQIMNSNARFASKMLGLLAEHTVITYGRFFCLTQKQTYGRFADVLLCLANRIYKSSKFPLHLSRRELAELSSMSVESIARILTRFKHDGLIAITSKHIEILDQDRLLEISLKG
ncbi:MAG: Crp/Fnr family transcriptional regulator [Bacteroidales bacterium]|nr:Crp/Fnr family transcriptional regulator [Bacteroidales bacterium]